MALFSDKMCFFDNIKLSMLYKTSLNRFVVIHSLLVRCLVNYNKLMNNNNIKNVYLIFNLYI